MPLCGHVSVFVCGIDSIPPTWRATRADGVPKVQRLADADGGRREVRREGLAGLEGRASAPVIHAMRCVCLCWTCSVRALERGVHGREVSQGVFALPSCSLYVAAPRLSPDLAAFRASFGIPCELRRLPKSLAIKSSQSPFSYLD